MRRSMIVALVILTVATAANACPFCPAPQVTLSERVSQSDVVALGQWKSAQRKSKQAAASTTFEIVHLATNPGDLLKAAQRISLVRYQAAKPGDLFLLLGTRKTVIEWDDPLRVTETGYQYVLKAPPLESRASDRLAYFLKFLEYPDEMISADAFNELASAEYKHIVPLAENFPRDKLRKWLANPDFTNPRLGMFSLLLGLCGSDEDAQLLARHIATPTKEFRLGIDGMIAGYLLLTGEKGLDFIDDKKLKDTSGPTTELFSAMQALRFVWTYGDGRIKKERLKQSMRILVDRADLADIAITDLTRWKDWSIQNRLIKLYDHKDYQSDHVKRAIVSYTIVASRDLPKNAGTIPKHVVSARKHLETLRNKDPRIVRRVERVLPP
ncbi:MAG: hypothetical protein HOL01_03455 [Planctomycetaceae bacterium]|nr:hypothetical protein [Planctomycetaceae bacterium]MBT6485606.1 hypothetical protein [Planctomycetaceae bacterium]MBT6493589.1 hypothetical protein [Planctomycetaceae bacterium]